MLDVQLDSEPEKPIRIHQLARELGVAGQSILSRCRAEGVPVRNHVQLIDARLADRIRTWFEDQGG